jgi:hypothetical protein
MREEAWSEGVRGNKRRIYSVILFGFYDSAQTLETIKLVDIFCFKKGGQELKSNSFKFYRLACR